MARVVARCYGKGVYFAHKIVSWEIEWMESRLISEGRRGCFVKTRSWFNDEGVQNAVREWLQGHSGDAITGHAIAKVVGEYLDSQRATGVVEEILKFEPGGNWVRARTAQRWLKKLGLIHGRYTKGVYIDGHEREDVVMYRKEVFIPQWQSFQHRQVVFKKDGTWELPTGKLDNFVVCNIRAKINQVQD